MFGRTNMKMNIANVFCLKDFMDQIWFPFFNQETLSRQINQFSFFV